MDHDAIIVGASFAGLACAVTLAGRGASVTVLDGKREAGDKLHTTGILVRDALDGVPLLDGLPPQLVRRIEHVRLYAPGMRYIDLRAPGYYFLATDTPGLLRWLAARAAEAGARLLWGSRFQHARAITSGYDLGTSYGSARVLVGADGPRSAVARSLGLGVNGRFLIGIEHEYADAPLDADDRLHCFIDRRCMPGYIGWVLQGVGVTQVGLARRQVAADELDATAAMRRFLTKIAPLFDFRDRAPVGVRAGLIPCAGVVHPGAWAARAYPRFRVKRGLRLLFDHCQADWVFDLLLGSGSMKRVASEIYFHRRGVN